MDKMLRYLKPNVVFEPLFDSWYAWSHLISPATSAMNVVDRHISIMESYIAEPKIHAQAVSDPRMRGGPFMDFGGGRVDEVKGLLQDTLSNQHELIAFSKAVKTLDRMLATEAKGFCLEELYAKIPTILKGFVELYYDRNNNADFRFFEPLLYKSQFFKKRKQNIALWITENDHRPFCLSTPRLSDNNVLPLSISFDDPEVDQLAKMKRQPGDVKYFHERFKISSSNEKLFQSLFTEDAPPVYERYTGDKIRMRYFGHACILIETREVNILIDPLISYYGYDSTLEHFSDMNLPDSIDYVLITHNHQDHILFETLLQLRHKIKNLIVPDTNSGKLEDPNLKLMFEAIGFKNVFALSEMESIESDEISIMAIPFIGEHSDLNILTKACYYVCIGQFKLMFLADSRIMDANLYKKVKDIIGNVDVLFLGMECDGAPLSWLYGPLMTKKLSREQDGSRRLAGSDCSKGMALVEIFHPKEVYVYAMGQEPWLEFISSIKYTDESNPIVQSDKLVKECLAKGIVSERLYGEKEILYNKVSAFF